MRRALQWALLLSLGACDSGSSPDAAGRDAAGSDAGMLDASGGLDTPILRDTPALDAAIDFTPGVVPSEAPDWVADLLPGAWSAISLDTIRDHDPGDDPSLNPNHPDSPPWRGNSGLGGIILAWGGGALASGHGSHGTLLIFGGGHADYWGSEVYGFDLGTRTWSRLSDPYPTPMLDAVDSYPEGFYPDGTPVPSHSSDRLEYHLATNSFVVLEGERNAFGGYVVPNPSLLALGGRSWRRGTPSTMAMGSLGWSAYDSRRDVIWTSGGCCTTNPVAAFDPDGVAGDGTFGAWSYYASHSVLNRNNSMAAYDPVRDVVAVTAFGSSPTIHVVDPTDPDRAPQLVSTTGAPPALSSGHGWEFSPSREAFLYWAGAHVYELRPTDGDWGWLDITNPAGAITPEYATNGVFSRFRVMSYGALDVAITVNSVDGAVYAFRVPAP